MMTMTCASEGFRDRVTQSTPQNRIVLINFFFDEIGFFLAYPPRLIMPERVISVSVG
jgi:hypothetical protein